MGKISVGLWFYLKKKAHTGCVKTKVVLWLHNYELASQWLWKKSSGLGRIVISKACMFNRQDWATVADGTGGFLQWSLDRVLWSEKDNKEARTCTIWSNRREDGKHQWGVGIVMESQTVKHWLRLFCWLDDVLWFMPWAWKSK